MKLGREVMIGKGKVDFPKVLAKLRQLGYRGAITIEREISGPEQMEDVRKEKAYLEQMLSGLDSPKRTSDLMKESSQRRG